MLFMVISCLEVTCLLRKYILFVRRTLYASQFLLVLQPTKIVIKNDVSLWQHVKVTQEPTVELGQDFAQYCFCVHLCSYCCCLSVLRYETDFFFKNMCHHIVPFCTHTSPCSCHWHASSQRDIISLWFFAGRCEKDPLRLPSFIETHFILQLKLVVDTYYKGVYIYGLFFMFSWIIYNKMVTISIMNVSIIFSLRMSETAFNQALFELMLLNCRVRKNNCGWKTWLIVTSYSWCVSCTWLGL